MIVRWPYVEPKGSAQPTATLGWLANVRQMDPLRII
jgi:hypothetical protein